MHQGQKKKELTRKYTADSGGIQRHQKVYHKGIANVLGEFYSKLYAEDQLGEEVQDPQNSETRMNTERESRIDNEFTQDEVQTAIDNLKKIKQVTTVETVLKISRHATERRKK